MILYQPESGYCYNSDSLFLYDFITKFTPKGRVLDVGAGCGIVGLLVARDNVELTLHAVEKQELYAEYVKKNAAVNEIECQTYVSDFLEFQTDEKYDFILSNPPFYPEGVQKSQNESLFHARYNVNLPLDPFFKKVSQLLKPHSHFIFCYDATQFGDVAAALAKVKMRMVDVQFVYPKKDRNASLVMIHARNGSKAQLRVLPPFICFEGEVQSKEALAVYAKAKTESIKCPI